MCDPKDGEPVGQARQFVRDAAAMPVELNRAAKVTSLENRPLAVVTASKESRPGWLGHQQELAKLSSNARHVIVADSTHQSLINDRADAARSSRAIRDVVHAVRESGGR